MEKLIEMANAGVCVYLHGPYYTGDMWQVSCEKAADGVTLNIKTKADTPEDCIDEAYAKWLRATGQGIPALNLNQITHVPEAPKSLDDEIPF